MPSTTIENYLKQIFLLSQEGEGGHVSMGRIAQRMAVVPGTATTMVKSMQRSGWLEYEARIGVTLTESGRELALRVLRKHRIVEMFLVQVLQLDWAEINEEAELLEHAISDKLVEKMDAYLGFPKTDPHGDPIPSASGKLLKRKLIKLGEANVDSRLMISRIKQQDQKFLQYIHNIGLIPGTEVHVSAREDIADVIEIQLPENKSVSLGSKAANHILVEIL